MKKIAAIVLIAFYTFLLSSTIQAQEEAKEKEFNTQKTEVNIAIADIFAKTLWYPYYDGTTIWPYYWYDVIASPKMILGMKFHTKSGAFRLGADIGYHARNNKSGNSGSDEYSNNALKTGVYFGYEWHSTFNRVNVFYGIDAFTEYSRIKTENQTSNDNHISRSNGIAYGVSPLVGVNYFITAHLSVGTEVKFFAEAYNNKIEYEYNGQEQPTDKTTGFRTYFGPLGFLSINIHF